MLKRYDKSVAPKWRRQQQDDNSGDAKEKGPKRDSYEQVRNTVMETEGQMVHNKSQTISNVKKPLPKGKRV